jgi:hypothetical protein
VLPPCPTTTPLLQQGSSGQRLRRCWQPLQRGSTLWRMCVWRVSCWQTHLLPLPQPLPQLQLQQPLALMRRALAVTHTMTTTPWLMQMVERRVVQHSLTPCGLGHLGSYFWGQLRQRLAHGQQLTHRTAGGSECETGWASAAALW